MRRGKKTSDNKTAKTTQSLPVLQPDAAGVDIHPRSIYVGVPRDRALVTVRSFGSFTPDLIEIADWLAECKIRTVAMESTGVYWIPLFELLEERGFEVLLVNAHHIKNVPGRKSDVADSQWIQFLHAVGLLRASYRPPKEICALRAIVRQRSVVVRDAARCVQHMQKSLDQMNLHLHHVLSNIAGMTGLDIIESILAGEHDPVQLSKLRDPRVKASEQEIEKALTGNYRPEHLFTLRQALATYRHFQAQIDECQQDIDRQIKELKSRERASDATIEPQDKSTEATKKRRRGKIVTTAVSKELERVLGVDLTRIPGIQTDTVEAILSEAGPNVATDFSSSGAFANWLQACPRTNKSGGKDLHVKAKKGRPRLHSVLRTAANTLHRSQSALGARFRRLKARLGMPKAITAMVHLYARMIYHLLKTQQQYDESVFADLEQKHQDRRLQNLKRTAHTLGFTLSPLEPLVVG
jgi:transposase